MAIGPVITRGFGSFGSVNLVVTRGYTPGEAIALDPAQAIGYRLGMGLLEYRLENKPMQYRLAAKPHQYRSDKRL